MKKSLKGAIMGAVFRKPPLPPKVKIIVPTGKRLAARLLLAIVAGVGLSCDRPVSEQHIGDAPAASRERAIERTPVRSSAMRSAGYNQEQRVLEIEFTNGDVYRYFDVPAEVYRGLLAAESHGRYFHQHVRGKTYRYRRIN